jgi:hypothetical protein
MAEYSPFRAKKAAGGEFWAILSFLVNPRAFFVALAWGFW